MLKAIAIDDEPLPLDLLQEFCSQTDFICLEKTFTKVSEAQKYLRKFPVDLIFLDVQMPKLSGIEFYKSLEQEVMVIFTTAHSQYAVEGFDLNAIDFLLKPFSFDRFLVAVSKANEFNNYQLKKENSDIQNLYVRSNYSLYKIPVTDILYIESFADYLDIHFADNKKITTRMSLKNIIEKLPQKEFMRVHRSFVVPLKRIEKVYKKTIRIAAKEIPIGTNFEADFFARFQT
ncbi:MAG: response regulator transcription factor [Bacteroidia bacterium]|nr:response regulator transcription factor [Bacteroidia bacterium]MCZ2249772.1 LytTR family DNA-binding domain-containing protein [Bacteroidia bacterium]